MRSRGYSTTRFKSLQTAYFNKPTPLQIASYDLNLIQLLRQQDMPEFDRIFRSGISPNPCNKHGESLLHNVCRRGETRFLTAMLRAGCQVQVTDDFGRTPLHDACWAATPHFDVVELLLERDPYLVQLADCRGSTPLAYVPKKDWALWLQFLESRKDEYWPKRDILREGKSPPLERTLWPPHSRPLPDPPHALPVDVAAQVASGRLRLDVANPTTTTGIPLDASPSVHSPSDSDGSSAESEDAMDADDEGDAENDDSDDSLGDSSDYESSSEEEDDEDDLRQADQLVDEMLTRVAHSRQRNSTSTPTFS